MIQAAMSSKSNMQNYIFTKYTYVLYLRWHNFTKANLHTTLFGTYSLHTFNGTANSML